MSEFKKKAKFGAVLTATALLNVPAALAQPVPGGTLDPTTIPKYVTPLVIPPVLYDDGGKKTGPKNPYEVSLRQINQQVLPAGFPATPLWAYGNPADPTTFNNPGFTIEVTKDTMTAVKWNNELVRNPARCYADPANIDNNIPACRYLRHIIKDQNNKPLVDQTLHWAAPNQDCLDGTARTDCQGASGRPYWGPIPMVTHVHGAHVGPGSDGYPEAWWLPNASNIPAGYATNGTFFESAEGRDTVNALGQGYAIDMYPNTQPTTTLWYHDHTLGITRLNVYAAGAGFWLIRDGNDGETGLRKRDALGNKQRLPGPAPKAGDTLAALNTPGDRVRNAVREIPLAIQPKSFNADGTQFYPADRAFFEGLGSGSLFADNTDVNIPFLPQGTSDIAPVWNPEAFFNTMVVNGKTWPQLEVAPERYRFRMVNASDSRFLNLAAFKVRRNGKINRNKELPFYQIGGDQSLLPQVVRVLTGEQLPLPGDGTVPPVAPDPMDPTALLVGPAERMDIIVDFSATYADGSLVRPGDVIRMVNTAPDAPFGGFPDVPADPGTTGQVMQFVVNSALVNRSGDPSTEPRYLRLTNAPGGVPKLGEPSVRRDLALLEEESALLCVTIDAVTGVIDLVPGTPPNCPAGSAPFAPKAAVLGVNGRAGGTVQLWDDPIEQNPAVGAIETWELWNWSADAHPIHLHLVKFQVLNRSPVADPRQRTSALPGERGWKDTVIAYPGEVTRVKALFDIPGLYVWHCHILSHEDNEMMVPYCVGTPGVDCPAELF